MAVQLGAPPLADFTRPIDLMEDCHRRIEHFLAVLIRLVDRYGARPLDAEAIHALEGALTYFRSAAPHHTADEEHSLFPRLRASDHPLARTAVDAAEKLEAEHRQAEARHATVDALGRRWIDEGTLPPAEVATLRAQLDALRRGYETHIRIEDRELFPIARQVLDSAALADAGREMRLRRGL